MEVDVAALRELARRWLDDDPDPSSQAELHAVIDALPASADDLADRFAGPLTFGTAGLRGPMRAGPNGMNLAVVRQAAAGLLSWLDAQHAHGPIVIGYDARHGSRRFAEETARVATGAGRQALVLPRALPTPVLAYAVREVGACAGVMVTASHNPPQDNGYKVYLGADLGGVGGAGAQIVPPVDVDIAAAIAAVGPLATVPLGAGGDVLSDDVVERYLAGALTVLDPVLVPPAQRSALVTAYTAMHGVGAAVLVDAFTRAGFAAPASVLEQAEPDPDFPTVAFPNPEEPGAMDLVLSLAADIGADIAIANDPDADRCAVAVVQAGRWRTLRGDEVGVLLADHLIRRGTGGLFATTIVSSSMLGTVCQARGVAYAETLTGFKWIVRAGGAAADQLTYGYEEALGYCVAPSHVRDKDGITAALLVAELAAALKAQGRTLIDRLDELAVEFGVHHTDQLSVRVGHLSAITQMMARLRANPPATLLAEPVTSVVDLAPAADVVIIRTPTARVVVRPSGTEPKLKAYLEIVAPVTSGAVPSVAVTSVAGASGGVASQVPPRDTTSDDVSAARERAATANSTLRKEVAATIDM